MSFEPLLNSPLLIQIHVVAACLALIMGPIAIWRRPRDHWHRVAGYLWVVAMLVTALSSFGILNLRLLGPFSPIHALSCYVLWSLWTAIAQARRGDSAGHRQTMLGLYIWGVCITGLATLLPGRLLHTVVTGPGQSWGIVPVLVLAGLAIIAVYRKRVLPLGKVRGLF